MFIKRAFNVLLSFSNCSITPSGRGGGGSYESFTSVNDVIVLFLVTPLMTLVNALVTSLPFPNRQVTSFH